MTIDPSELVPDGETARLLDKKRNTLAGWRCAGEGPAFVKVGRRVYYRRADIMAWLGTQRREPTRKAVAA